MRPPHPSRRTWATPTSAASDYARRGTRWRVRWDPGYDMGMGTGEGAFEDRARLMAEEERGWRELMALVEGLRPEDAVRPGYFEEGWSAKDALAHVGTWLAEAGVAIQRISSATYRREELDIDALNAAFHEAMADVPPADVRTQAVAARSRMLHEWGTLASPSPEADWWVRKSGPDHYAEHVPRLRSWVEELRNGSDRTRKG